MNNALRGKVLEDFLQHQHNIYNANRLALVWHNGTSGMIRRGKAILVRSQPDYSGILTCMGGRHISFDAKLTATPRYHHPTDRLHQLSALWEVQEAGGISFLLISIELERFFLIWPDLSWRDQRPFSLNLDTLEDRPDRGIEFYRDGGYGLANWLKVVRALSELGSI